MDGSGFLFREADYGPEVAAILALEGDGQRLMPLVMERCSSEAARGRLRAAASASRLFEEARAPEAALSGRISQEAPGEAPATPENLIAGAKLSQSIRRNGVTCCCRQAAHLPERRVCNFRTHVQLLHVLRHEPGQSITAS